jgi:hypothetical protein
MTELPRILAPWATQIADLLPDLALALVPWLQRLDLVIGPMRSLASPGDGEPDGFSGLTRRGPYDRLLISEWLLASEVPEEFLRRAASGEHAFHELARREPTGDRACLALLDLGPSQLGAPRVAHLALLLVLWRRAQLAGADFRWARAQGGEIRERLDAASLVDLHLGQGARELDDEGFAAWQARPELRQAKGEIWWIGGPAICQRARRAGLPSVEIRDPLEPGQRLLVAQVRPPGRPAAEVSLPLPPPEDCVRLLREPFRKRAAPPAAPLRTPAGRKLATAHRPVFSHNGRRLFVALESGGVIVYAVPNSPNAPPAGAPVEYRAALGDRVIAGAWLQNRPQLLVERGAQLRLLDLGRKGGLVQGSSEIPADPPGTDSSPDATELRALQQIAAEVESWKQGAPAPPSPRWPRFGPLLTLPNTGHRFFVDERRRLRQIDTAAREATVLQGGVVGLAQSNHNVVLALDEAEADGRTVRFVVYQGVTRIVPVGRRHPIHGHEVFFGLGGLSYQTGPAAFEESPGEWVILHGNPVNEHRNRVPPGVVVVGVRANSDPVVPSLLAIVDQRRLVDFSDHKPTAELIRMTSPIAQVATSPTQSVVAVLAENGELCLYSLSYEKPLLRVFPGDEASSS